MPDDHDGEWWLWWPKKGRGVCRDCGQSRAVTRYSGRLVDDYRYLCARCRAQERDDQSAYLARLTGVTPDPGEDATSLFARRTAARLERVVEERLSSGQTPDSPTSKEHSGAYADTLDGLLAPLVWAGWEVPDRFGTEDENAAVLYGQLDTYLDDD